jgi:alpha-glucosidase (family GH31 glycosyl hydrolase)
MTLSLNASHPSNDYIQYDTHSLNGLLEAWRTRAFLTNATWHDKSDDRTFMLSRSTFAGAGQYAQHWLGDNHRTFDDMRYSIAGVMNFNMFGIPLTGPDTCGFFGESDQDQICGRWIQLATFYPFARQHRDRDDARGGGPNEPYNLKEPYMSMAKNALYNRLQYVRQMYTCLYMAQEDGETCFDPLLFHFPEDDEVLDPTKTEHSFIFANSLKITPVLTENATTVMSYFPNGKWVNMNDMSKIVDANGTKDGKMGEWVTLDSPLDNMTLINTHLMPGAMVITQDNSEMKYKKTADLMMKDTIAPINITINRDHNMAATGNVFLDDGISLSSLVSG